MTKQLEVGKTYTSKDGTLWLCIAVNGNIAHMRTNDMPSSTAYVWDTDGTPIGLPEKYRIPFDAIAAREARDKQVREEALREAWRNLWTYAPHEDHTTGPEHDIGYAVGYRTAMNRVLALIEGETDE